MHLPRFQAVPSCILQAHKVFRLTKLLPNGLTLARRKNQLLRDLRIAFVKQW